jgi:hypothetical protein
MLFRALRSLFDNHQFFFVLWLLLAVKTSIATSSGNLSQSSIRWLLNVSVEPTDISNSSKRLRIDDEPPEIFFYLLVLVYLSSAICCILLCSRLFAFCRYLHRCLPHHKHDAHCSCRYIDPGTPLDEISIEVSAADVNHPPPPPPKPPETAAPSPKKKTGPDGSAVSSCFPVSTHGPSSSGTITTFCSHYYHQCYNPQ